MEMNFFVNSEITVKSAAIKSADFGTVLTLCDVNGLSSWDAQDIVKTYTSTTLATDFTDSNHPVRKLAQALFSQSPKLSKIKVARQNAGQTVSQALDAAEAADSDWYCLVGVRGAEITNAAAWIEQQNRKFMIAADGSDLILASDYVASSNSDVANDLKDGAYKKTLFFYHHLAGTRISGAAYTVSTNVVTVTLPSGHGIAVDDVVYLSGSSDANLVGSFTVATSGATSITLAVTTADGSGSVHVDAGKSEYADAALAGMALAYSPGSIDWAFKDIAGITPTPESKLTSNAISYLRNKNANWFCLTGGRRIFFEGKTCSGVPADLVVGLVDWLSSEMETSIFSYISGQKRFSMSDISLVAVHALMSQALERARKAGLTSAFVEDKVSFPETGYPEGASAGDHYVIKVPTLKEVPLSERQNNSVLTGISYEVQAAGGIHFLIFFGNVNQ